MESTAPKGLETPNAPKACPNAGGEWEFAEPWYFVGSAIPPGTGTAAS